MTPNEMQRYDLVGEYELDMVPQERGDYVHYSEAMQVISILTARIADLEEQVKAVYSYTCRELAEPLQDETSTLYNICTILEEVIGMAGGSHD